MLELDHHSATSGGPAGSRRPVANPGAWGISRMGPLWGQPYSHVFHPLRVDFPQKRRSGWLFGHCLSKLLAPILGVPVRRLWK